MEAIERPFSRPTRRPRLARFVARMRPQPGERPIDLGGNPRFRADLDGPPGSTAPNLPGAAVEIAALNSVIEQVDGPAGQADLAAEGQRPAARVLVRLPSIRFVAQAPTCVPGCPGCPAPLGRQFTRRRAAKLPDRREPGAR